MKIVLSLRRISSIFLVLVVLRSMLVLGQDIELSASSPFNMVIGPVLKELDSSDLQVVEDGMAAVLEALVVTNENYLDIEAVIQESDFLNSQQNFPSSRIRFFVLATTTSCEESPRVTLNRLIEESLFESVAGETMFFDFLRASNRITLQNVSSVDIAPLLPSTAPVAEQEESSASSKKLSSLDIILIAVCGLIFLGILYMIFQHHKDRGYIENRRVMAANQPIRDSHTGNEEDSTPRSIHILPKADTDANGNDAPSTPSTIHSNEFYVKPHIISPPDFQPKQRKQQVRAMTSKALLKAESVDGTSVKSITESFDSSWFGNPSTEFSGTPTKTGSEFGNYTNPNEASKEDPEEQTSVASEESDDVFFVNMENASSTPEERISNSSAMSDWMKTIRVVSSPSKTSEMTQSSHEASSSGPSLTLTMPDDCASLEQRSLENSMASSHPDAPPPRPTIVEV
eukprot:CAMPEP_0172445924 /NCGR_PEP_ID=MMETSP1065-20121228/5676_1 /TAXON_ID=265537 /ORGANISM="Amphiprora paludosa, Strain CCMP125" /LENGTH=456 /DNA_ID=CAMNT_0013196937 /DNA_START=385 /DNA_END=1755 /DNA_ORIENTATION=+